MKSIRIYMPETLLDEFRAVSMSRFGYGKGSLSKAAEAAIYKWLSEESYIKSQIDRIIDTSKNDKNVIATILFGSYARGENYQDVDIAILLKQDNIDSTEFLADYTDPKGLVDISIMNRLPLNVQARVLSEGKLLYCFDKKKMYDYQFAVIAKWGDFKHRFDRIVAARACL